MIQRFCVPNLGHEFDKYARKKKCGFHDFSLDVDRLCHSAKGLFDQQIFSD